MICINCFHENTAVVNSRTKKKQPSVWRRRRCTHCKATFTTYERPSAADTLIIHGADTSQPFNMGKLILSIGKAFTHAPEQAAANALWLAQTVEDNLYIKTSPLARTDVLQVTHTVLKRFDELAALQYAAQHQLISSVRRRGRPSLVSREPQNRPSPSL